MLSPSQIKFAETCSKHVDTVPDFAGETIAFLHHTVRGVFVIVRDSVSEDILDSFHIPYRWLAAMNYRDWPITAVGGQRKIVEDAGEYYVVRGRTGVYYEEKKALTMRDACGFPRLKTEWALDGKGYWRVTHHGKRKKDSTDGTVDIEMNGVTRTLRLNDFNNRCEPRRL